MKNYKRIELIETCGACPEQYDAYYEGQKVGYLRLRHGYFRAEYKGKIVYDTQTIGYGMFGFDERKIHLKKAKKKIYRAMIKDV